MSNTVSETAFDKLKQYWSLCLQCRSFINKSKHFKYCSLSKLFGSSHLFSLLDMIILSWIWATNKHDFQLSCSIPNNESVITEVFKHAISVALYPNSGCNPNPCNVQVGDILLNNRTIETTIDRTMGKHTSRTIERTIDITMWKHTSRTIERTIGRTIGKPTPVEQYKEQ